MSTQKSNDRSLEQLSSAAMRAFLNIASAWDLNDNEARKLVGWPDQATFSEWVTDPDNAILQTDTLERISYILGIYKALQVLFPDPSAADAWVKKANTAPLFGGMSALNKMISGEMVDLQLVRQYLDSMLN